MVIYATEFVLWCGVFACGGYLNLRPWVKQRKGTRSQRDRGERDAATPEITVNDEGISHDVELDRLPSSTSVFRTPTSVAS
jgi:hypothetical protein